MASPMSEATLAYMLSLVRDMPTVALSQARNHWERWPAALLAGKTVGILGVGLISEHLAPMCKAFDMTVVGISRGPAPGQGLRPHGPPRRSAQGRAPNSTSWW